PTAGRRAAPDWGWLSQSHWSICTAAISEWKAQSEKAPLSGLSCPRQPLLPQAKQHHNHLPLKVITGRRWMRMPDDGRDSEDLGLSTEEALATLRREYSSTLPVHL